MQTLVLEKMAFTFAGDAHALLAGFGDIVVGFVTAPVERIANSCDFTGAYAHRRQMERARRQNRRRLAVHEWRRLRERLLDRINPFRGLRHLT